MLKQDFHQKLAGNFVSILFCAFFDILTQAANSYLVGFQKFLYIRGVSLKIIPLEADEKFLKSVKGNFAQHSNPIRKHFDNLIELLKVRSKQASLLSITYSSHIPMGNAGFYR